MTLLISNRGDTVKLKDYRKKNKIIEVERALLKSLGKRRGFEASDYWTHALVDGEKHLVCGV